jgi:hypothetical protein
LYQQNKRIFDGALCFETNCNFRKYRDGVFMTLPSWSTTEFYNGNAARFFKINCARKSKSSGKKQYGIYGKFYKTAIMLI